MLQEIKEEMKEAYKIAANKTSKRAETDKKKSQQKSSPTSVTVRRNLSKRGSPKKIRS